MPLRDPRRFRRLLPRALLLPVGLLLAGVLVWAVGDLLQAQERARRAQVALTRLERVRPLFIDRETGGRGHLLTGEPIFLQPYHAAGQQLPLALEELERAMADSLFARGAHVHRAGGPLPALVVLDLELPRLDGHEVLRQIRANARTRFLPVVIPTSSDEENDLVASDSHDCNSYVRKPVSGTGLVEAARQLGFHWLVLNRSPRPGVSG